MITEARMNLLGLENHMSFPLLVFLKKDIILYHLYMGAESGIAPGGLPRGCVHACSFAARVSFAVLIVLCTCSFAHGRDEKCDRIAGSSGFTLLPEDGEPWKVGNEVWNTWLAEFAERYSTTKNGKNLELKFARRNVSLESGARFLSSPKEVFPSDELTFRYQVYFKRGFNFVKSGKLPGIYLGTYQEGYSTGKDYKYGQGSFRPSWQVGKSVKNAYIAPYLYGAHGSYDKAFKAQGPKTADTISGGGRAGIHFWENESADLVLKPGWNTMELAVKLNTPGVADGRVRVRVNGREKTLDDVSFREREDTKIQSIAIECFFGGSSKYHMTPGYVQTVRMKNFQIRPQF